jgi:short-subunit dehydrogenase
LNFDYFNLKTLRISYISSFLQGASSGIGRATAILFSKLGSNLTVVGRDEKALNETVNNCQNSQNVISVVNK